MKERKTSGPGRKLAPNWKGFDSASEGIREFQSFLLSSLGLPLVNFGKQLVDFLKRITGLDVLFILIPRGDDPLVFQTGKFPRELIRSGGISPEFPGYSSFRLNAGKGEEGIIFFKTGKEGGAPRELKSLLLFSKENLERVIRFKMREEFLKKEQSLHKTFSRLLRMTLAEAPIEKILDFALQYLLGNESLLSSGRGSICLLSPDGRLEVAAKKGFFGEEDRPFCEAIAGKGIRIERHKVPGDEGLGHSHLLVPIRSRSNFLGYINLILKNGEKPGKASLEFVEEISRMLGAIIWHYRQEDKARFHSQILSQFKGGVIAHDQEGRISYLNPEASKILKGVLEEYPIQELPNFLPRPFQRNGEITLKGKRGERRFQSSTFPLKKSKFADRVTVFQDITLKKLAEEAQRKAQERFRVLFENTREGVVFIDSNGDVLFANRSAAEILGFKDPEELKGKNTSDFYLNPEMRSLLLQEISGQGFLKEREVPLKRKDGTAITALVSVVPMEGDGGPPLYGVIFSDITPKKEAEEKSRANLELYKKVLEETVNAFSLLAETRDPYLAGHQTRVTQLSCAIAQEMGLGEERIKGLKYASLLHDPGKLGVPLEILSEPGRLNEMEFNLIKIHPQISFSILKNIPFPWPVAEIAYQHHERLDGSGYPRGLKGEEILLEARILGVADVVEAMSSHRPYRPALGIEEALKEIEGKKGVLYDPRVVDACLSLFREKGFKLSLNPSGSR